MLRNLVLIEKQAMQQDVTIDAKAMADGLRESGRVAIYGILFDTGKAELKSESGSALIEIATLLMGTPGWRFSWWGTRIWWRILRRMRNYRKLEPKRW
jgi:outer membrane protein OmpA-like peptidoglycan-associated protein